MVHTAGPAWREALLQAEADAAVAQVNAAMDAEDALAPTHALWDDGLADALPAWKQEVWTLPEHHTNKC